jgi:AcrR family transcriptional regulator
MARIESSDELTTIGDRRRRADVLESALGTFARFGYRKTSMEEVARAAHISRPGLYFLFSSKESLFRAAVEQALQRDIDAVAEALGENDRPLRDRLLASFDLWAGRYVGAFAREVTVVIEDNPDLLGAVVERMPQRFEELIIAALTPSSDPEAARRVAQTLISASIGMKYQVDERAEYRDRMTIAIALLVR